MAIWSRWCSARGIDGGWCDLRERRGPERAPLGIGQVPLRWRLGLLFCLSDSLHCCPPTRRGRSSQPMTGEGPSVRCRWLDPRGRALG